MLTAPSVKRGFSPLDRELGLLANHAYTPRLEEGMVRLGSWLPFEPARAQLAFFTGTTVGEATLRRQTELSGAACVQLQAEQVTTLPNQPSNPSPAPTKALMSVDGAFVQLVGGEWREVKTLVVGQIEPPILEKGKMVVHSTALSYFSRMTTVREFEEAATLELERRNIFRAEQVCAVNDGAEWCQSFVAYHRPDAVCILDQPDAFEHLAKAGRAVFGEAGTSEFEGWYKQQREQLRKGDSQVVLDELGQLGKVAQAQKREGVAQVVGQEQAYLRARQGQMRYAEFEVAGYPVGSGAVESGNKNVVEARLKGTGMRWAEPNVNPMLALRNLVCNDRWEEGWQACRDWQLGAARASAVVSQPSGLALAEVEEGRSGKGKVDREVKAQTEAEEKEARVKVIIAASKSEKGGSSKPAAEHPWRRMPIGKAQFRAFAKN